MHHPCPDKHGCSALRAEAGTEGEETNEGKPPSPDSYVSHDGRPAIVRILWESAHLLHPRPIALCQGTYSINILKRFYH
jgi:hypothetical protein